jgi:hypothetical protein
MRRVFLVNDLCKDIKKGQKIRDQGQGTGDKKQGVWSREL